ncbi:MAG: hypothetical protein ABSB83_02960 [Methanomassiliicoccales archaeon]
MFTTASTAATAAVIRLAMNLTQISPSAIARLIMNETTATIPLQTKSAIETI